MSAGGGVRTMVVLCPDWPVVAAVLAGRATELDAVAVFAANRAVACSPQARDRGVRRGLRRRDTQGRCPELVVVGTDDGRDAAYFEPVIAAVEQMASGVMTLRAGSCAFAVRGPAGYFGGENAVAEAIIEQVATETGIEIQVGVADGVLAGLLAARAARIVEAGQTAAFLSELPITVLEHPVLVDLLQRLGIQTLGAFAALPADDVLARFGLDGAIAHRAWIAPTTSTTSIAAVVALPTACSVDRIAVLRIAHGGTTGTGRADQPTPGTSVEPSSGASKG